MSFSWQGAPQKHPASSDNWRKLFADKWDLVLGFSSIYWWVLLAGGAQYHGGFLLHASRAEWITLQGAKGIWSRSSAVKQWQETSEESGHRTADGEKIVHETKGMPCIRYKVHFTCSQAHFIGLV